VLSSHQNSETTGEPRGKKSRRMVRPREIAIWLTPTVMETLSAADPGAIALACPAKLFPAYAAELRA
jgi:hypothetical protein